MLDRLTKRERLLAMVVASMLPFLLVFGFLYWAYSSYTDHKSEIISLQDRVGDEEIKEAEMLQANDRKNLYKSFSLPADLDLAKTQYRDYLADLGEETLGVSVFPLKPMQDSEKKYRNQEKVYDQIAYQVSACETTFEQLVQFLYEFHRTKLAQRIRDISIRPLDDAKGKRLNRIKVSMTFEAIALIDAEAKRDFQTEKLEQMALDLEGYQDAILYRNIFGGPNVQPVIATVRAPDFVEGDQVRFKIDIEDENENQKLVHELIDVDSKMPNAELTKGFTDRSVNFNAGVLPIGRYEFTYRVSDNGCPTKETTKKYVVRVEKKKVEPKDPIIPDPPKFQHSKATYITALLQGLDGEPVVWIDTRTLSKVPIYKLRIGETFELDDSQWLVKSIDLQNDVVTLTRDEKNYQYKNGDVLFVESMRRKPSEADEKQTSIKPGKNGTDQDEEIADDLKSDTVEVETKASDDLKSEQNGDHRNEKSNDKKESKNSKGKSDKANSETEQ